MQSSSRSIDATVLEMILEAIGKPPRSVYEPAEDSFLMLETISSVPLDGKQVLDLGTGTGILGLFCALRGAAVTIADINDEAVQQASRAAESLGVNVKAVGSDIFSNIQERYDLILFNPPYLPSRTISDDTIDGGPAGSSLVTRFLQDLPGHLKKGGAAFLLLSSLNNPARIIDEHLKFHFTTVAKRSLFFEEIRVLHVGLREGFAA